ncbi:MAG: methyltransferase domain-containing protein [Pelovirga sp.]
MTNFDDRASSWDDDPAKVRRAQTVAAAIRAAVHPDRTMTALEYGCGTGLLSFALQGDLGEILLADNAAGMLAVVDRKIASAGVDHLSSIRLDLSSAPLPDRRFDLIYSLMTLHHVGDFQGLLTQFYALLRPSGHLCIADLDSEEGTYHDTDFAGHPGFDRGQLAAVLRRIGFIAVTFTTVFQIRKERAGQIREYPLFLMVCRKP